ncbi:hypothetical protein POV27_08495 [Aureisphaera galaxeae]|uniref:hypothetical protein n=1 Tax=Aureisphaera galaxeae TaxID=1538023 RepID=UPI002350101B|nr:hypothetical protein [Aureisphaera galaxeae]MDC8004090.1 hypothetical protein [Aureisphaera galaxeae]
MESEDIDINAKHFIASVRYNKSQPEDFGLTKVKGKEHYIDTEGNLWQNEYLWDSGWGNEYGFIKLPEPNFEQLWTLLTKSKIKENVLGAAELLNGYPKELKDKLQELFKNHKSIDRDLTKRLAHLELLNHVTNHSETHGKKYEEVNEDFQVWKKLKDDFDRLKTDSFIQQFKKTITSKRES